MESPRPNPSAAAQFAGYLYQLDRAIFRLASARAEVTVGVETSDDVTELTADSSLIYEQDKFSGQPRNPYADRSRNLWKTLSNWYEADLRENKHRIEAFHLVTNRVVPDCLARRLGGATDDRQVDSCIRELRVIAETLPQGARRYGSRILAADARSLESFVRRVKLYDAAAAEPNEEISTQITEALPIPSRINSSAVLKYLRGWIGSIARERWASGEQLWLTRADFLNELHAIVTRLESYRVLERAQRYFTINSEEREAARTKHFVHHLALVGCDDEDVDRAIDDYLRFCTEKTRLVHQGEVTVDDWVDREGRLKRRWSRIVRTERRISNSRNQEEVGRRILAETTDSGHKEPLASYDTREEYLTSGHYHRLADVDEVWWHPGHRGSSEE